MNNLIKFQNTELTLTSHNNQLWLASKELAKGLGYADTKAVTRIYNRNREEFTSDMTCGVKLTSQGQVREIRVFSPRGCHLIAMFARTPFAKEFRKWVLDVLEQYNTCSKVPVKPYTRRLPSVKKEIVLSDKEHKAIGGIVKKCVAVAVKETLGSFLSPQEPLIAELKPNDKLTKAERKLAEAVVELGFEKERIGKIKGMLEGAMNTKLVEVMKQARQL